MTGCGSPTNALSETHPTVLDLHAEAARIAFLRKDFTEGDRQVAIFAKRKRSGCDA